MEAPAAAAATVTALALHTGARGRPYTAPAVTGADERERERCRCRVLPAGALTLRTPHAVVDSPYIIEAARTSESSGAAAGAWECSGRIRRWWRRGWRWRWRQWRRRQCHHTRCSAGGATVHALAARRGALAVNEGRTRAPELPSVAAGASDGTPDEMARRQLRLHRLRHSTCPRRCARVLPHLPRHSQRRLIGLCMPSRAQVLALCSGASPAAHPQVLRGGRSRLRLRGRRRARARSQGEDDLHRGAAAQGEQRRQARTHGGVGAPAAMGCR